MNIYDIHVTNNEGKDVALKDYEGKTLLIVNTATKCGFTPQYKALEALYKKYQDQGFLVLDFPCNQFFFQAPGSDKEINDFATLNYGTTFPRFQKIEVNGKNESPLYTYLKEQKKGRIKWNFTKFLVSSKGEVLARYEPATKPEDFEKDIQDLLGKSEKKETPKNIKEINKLTLAMLTGCPHCKTAVIFLKKYGVTYDELNWSDSENDATFEALGIKEVPVLLIPGEKGLERIQGEQAIGEWAKKQAQH
jgi:glutathione peroxidase